jgi:HEAT repeat protein
MDYTDNAIEAIHELYEHVPLDILLHALSSTTQKRRWRAVILLGILQERTPIELLLSFLKDKDPAMRAQAIGALSHHLTRIPPELIVNMLKDRQKEVRSVASSVLLKKHADIPAELLLPFLDCPENIARATAIELAGKCVPMTRLIAATHDPKWTVRQAAITVLGTMSEQVPLDVFLEALCDRNLSVRTMALIALGNQGERAPISILIDALRDRRCISEAAGEILEKLNLRVPHELVLQMLDNSMAHVRRKAIHLLQTIDYKETFPIEKLRHMLQDHNAEVRETAILALNQVEALEPAEPFIAALSDTDRNVRKATLLVLTKLGERAPREQLKALLGEGEIYTSIIVCLQKTHPDILREVVDEASNILLGKGAGPKLGSLIQENAAEIIGNMRNPGPLLVNKLFELLSWPYGNVRKKAELALRKLGKEGEIGVIFLLPH